MNNFDILIEMLELIIEEKTCKRGGGDQYCFNFGNVENPAEGKNINEIEQKQQQEEKEQKRAEKAEKRKQATENKKARDNFNQEHQLDLFDTNKEDKENGET